MTVALSRSGQDLPTLPIAYSDKFVGVMETIGIKANVVDLRKMNEDEVFSVIDRALEGKAEVRQQLARTMPQIKEAVPNLFADMENGGDGDRAPSTAGHVPVGV